MTTNSNFTWNIIETFFQDNPQVLVQHHINSYNDFFKTDKLFHWQSEKGTREDNHHGLAVINHKKNNSDIHLFVRSSYAAAKEFAYCGKINFLNGKGSGPFDVDFQLETPLTGDIKEEFLRISKLITKDK